MATLMTIDYVLIAVYFLVLLYIGYKVSRKQKEDDYLIGERKLSSFSTMATVNASKTGSILMIFVALVYLWGISAIWYFIGMIIGVFIFIPFAMKLKDNSKHKFYTLADYFKYNYGKKVAKFVSIITIFLMFGYLVMNLMAGTKIFVFFTSWPFWICAIIMVAIVLVYLLMGGFKAVVKTDVLQYAAIIILLGLMALMLFNGSIIPSTEWNLFRASIGTIIGFFIVGILFPFAMPDLWQRVYSSKDKKSLKKGLLWSIGLYALFAICIGLIALTVKAKFPGIDPDIALIHGFANLLPVGLLGLASVLLFAAIMSSIDTYIFTGASSIVQDFFKKSKKNIIKLIKQVIVIFAVLGTAVSILIQSLVLSTYIFVSVILVLGVIVMATWIKKKIRTKTLLIALTVGIILLAIVFAYFWISTGTLQPIVASLAIVGTLIGLGIGAIVSKIKK